MESRLLLWVREWPDGKERHVFLADAMNQLGRAMFGEAWEGTEPRFVERRTPRDADAWRRLRAVCDAVVREARGGRLVFATRPPNGGSMSLLPAVAWQTESRVWSPRFDYCQIDPGQPYSLSVYGRPYQRMPSSSLEYLFVTADSLAPLVGALGSASAPVGPADYAASPKRAKGRPPGSSDYDWPTFEREALAKLKAEGGIIEGPASGFRKADLTRHMASWCDDKWKEKQPVDSMIRAHVDLAVQRYAAEISADKSEAS